MRQFILLFLLSCSHAAIAAIEPLDIEVTIGSQVKISKLDDIDFGQRDGNSTIRKTDEICIFRNGNGRYKLKMTAGANNGQADALANDRFALENNNGDKLPYKIRFDDAVSGAWKVKKVLINQAITSGKGHKTSIDCNGQNNARVQVVIKKKALQQAKPGSYVGTLYLVASPD